MDWFLYARLYAAGLREDLIAAVLGISVDQLRAYLSYAGISDEPDESDPHWYGHLLDAWQRPA